MGLAYNPWLNVAATATAGGEVVIMVGPVLGKQLENDKDSTKRRVYLTRMTEDGNDEDKSYEFVDMKNGCEPENFNEEELKLTRYCEKMQKEEVSNPNAPTALHRVAMSCD